MLMLIVFFAKRRGNTSALSDSQAISKDICRSRRTTEMCGMSSSIDARYFEINQASVDGWSVAIPIIYPGRARRIRQPKGQVLQSCVCGNVRPVPYYFRILASAGASCWAIFFTSSWRKQPATWSFTIPTACMKA